jgi:hypothetical protein
MLRRLCLVPPTLTTKPGSAREPVVSGGGVGPVDGGVGGRAPPRPAGTADGRYRRDRAVVHLPGAVIEEGRDRSSSMSGSLAGTAYCLLLA